MAEERPREFVLLEVGSNNDRHSGSSSGQQELHRLLTEGWRIEHALPVAATTTTHANYTNMHNAPGDLEPATVIPRTLVVMSRMIPNVDYM